ncbi:MAG: ATP-binding protein, partial [Candidatus Binatia bacterium]
MLVLDDLHAADVPSLLLLRFLGRDLQGTRILAVGSTRDVEARMAPDAAAVMAEITRDARSLSLGGLSDEEIARFVAVVAGRTPSGDLVRAIRERTGGNPLFVGEVVRVIAAEPDVLRRASSGHVHAVPVPDAIRHAFIRRIDRLAESTRAVLRVASAIGREFSVSVLERTTHIPREAILAALDQAAGARIVDPVAGAPGRHRFSHALVGEALYTAVPKRDRARLHFEIGLALESLQAGDVEVRAAELARHFVQAAELGESAAKALEHCTRAGDCAARVLAFEDAAAHYEDALRALDLEDASGQADDSRRCDLLLAIGDSQKRAGAMPKA